MELVKNIKFMLKEKKKNNNDSKVKTLAFKFIFLFMNKRMIKHKLISPQYTLGSGNISLAKTVLLVAVK